MRTLFHDFESYYDSQYSLRKMTPVEYILDPRFEATGCAFKWGIGGVPFWVDGPDLQRFFDSVNPNDTMTVAHNAPFDASIAAWRYGFVPKMMVCTLGIGRALKGHLLRSLSLDKLSDHLGLGSKIAGTLPKVIGMRLNDIRAAGLYDDYVTYALQDVELCAGIFKSLVLSGEFPPTELVVLDSVLRATVVPKFVVDQPLLQEHLQTIVTEKELLLAHAMLAGADGKSDLMSNDRFAELLREVGVEPPMKISLVTGKQAYAFAKTDQDFIALEEHPDERVQVLVAARLGHKTTLEETRTERLITISNLDWGGRVAPNSLPIPLRYAAAHTHRLGGDWQLNMQNLPARGKSQALRKSLKAPPGHVVYAPDSSQIEARGVATFCGQEDLRRQFETGEDVYASFGSLVFGFRVNKKDHPAERFVGKTGVLGLGYAVGHAKFRAQVKVQSQQAVRVGALTNVIDLSEDQSKRVVDLYRSGYQMVPRMWRTLDSLIASALFGGSSVRLGCLLFQRGEIVLPNGLKLKYLDLHKDAEGTWRYIYGGVPKRLYGGALLENIMQALARIIVMDTAVRVRTRTGESFAMQVHDELVYIIPREVIAQFMPIVEEEMCRRPLWMPDWPLAQEGKPALNYADT